MFLPLWLTLWSFDVYIPYLVSTCHTLFLPTFIHLPSSFLPYTQSWVRVFVHVSVSYNNAGLTVNLYSHLFIFSLLPRHTAASHFSPLLQFTHTSMIYFCLLLLHHFSQHLTAGSWIYRPWVWVVLIHLVILHTFLLLFLNPCNLFFLF